VPFRPIILQQVTLNSTRRNASVFRDWDAVVELYSLGALTYPKDKLVALSGLASAISIGEGDATGDGYLAGLWHSSLPSHLLWTTEKSERVRGGTQEILIPARNEQDYIAPSWSWASIDGKVSLTWCQHNYDSKDYLVTIDNAEVTSSDMGARFGRIESGFVKLSGPLASVLWEESNWPSVNARQAKIAKIYPKHFSRETAVSMPPRLPGPGEIIFDTVQDMPEELTLLPIIGTMRRTGNNEMVAGLVLRDTNLQAEEYVRVGFFYTSSRRTNSIFRNMPRKTITII